MSGLGLTQTDVSIVLCWFSQGTLNRVLCLFERRVIDCDTQLVCIDVSEDVERYRGKDAFWGRAIPLVPPFSTLVVQYQNVSSGCHMYTLYELSIAFWGSFYFLNRDVFFFRLALPVRFLRIKASSENCRFCTNTYRSLL